LHQNESEIVEWIKELEQRREKLDKQIATLGKQLDRIQWRITQLEEFKRGIEEGSIQTPQPDLITETAELEMKNLAQLKGERKEHTDQITAEREFCNVFINYLRSKLESAW